MMDFLSSAAPPSASSHVLDTPDGMAPYLTDSAAALPAGAGRAASRLGGGSGGAGARLRRTSRRLVPQGGNTGLVLGSVPDASGAGGAVAGAAEPHPQVDASTAP
jgi:hypothetical protein